MANIASLKPLLSRSSTFTIPGEAFAEDYNNWTNYALITPKAVVKTTSESDIQTVVKFASEHNLRVSVRGGGHSTFNSCDGIILDLAGWDEVVYDDGDETIRFRPGALAGKVVGVAGGRGRCVSMLFHPILSREHEMVTRSSDRNMQQRRDDLPLP